MIPLKPAIVGVAALVVQLTLFVDVRIFGFVPELPVLLAVLAGYYLDAERGPIVAFGLGLLWDAYLSTPLGVAAITFALVAFSVATLAEGLFHDTRRQLIGIVALGSAACVVGYAMLAALVGQRGLVDLDLLRVAAIVGVLNAALTPVLAPVMRWALVKDGS